MDLLPLIDIERLCIRYEKEPQHALYNISFELYQGQDLGIIGESGSGKSTLVKAMLGLIQVPISYKADKISYCLNDEKNNLIDKLLKRKFFRRNIWGKESAFYFQDPRETLNPYFSIDTQGWDTFCYQYDKKSKQREEFNLHLKKLQLEKVKEQLPETLSGGEQQRAMILVMHVAKPRLIIADEVTTGLDMVLQRRVIAHINNYRKIYPNSSVVFITHEIGLLNQVIESPNKEFDDKLIVLYKGRLVEEFPRKSQDSLIDDDIHHPYTDTLLKASNMMFDEEDDGSNHLQHLDKKYPTGCIYREQCPIFTKLEKCIQSLSSDHQALYQACKTQSPDECPSEILEEFILSNERGVKHRVICHAVLKRYNWKHWDWGDRSFQDMYNVSDSKEDGAPASQIVTEETKEKLSKTHRLEKFKQFVSIPTQQRYKTASRLRGEGAVLIHAQNISHLYKGQKTYALNKVTLTISRGENLALVGQSGSGKSTLAKILALLLEPDDGEITYAGEYSCYYKDGKAEVCHMALDKLRNNYQLVFQSPGDVFHPKMTIRSILKEAIRVFYRLYRQEERPKFNDADMKVYLEYVKMKDVSLDRYSYDLSGGEKKRLLLARTLASWGYGVDGGKYKDIKMPKVIFIDEPLRGVDSIQQQEIVKLLYQLREDLNVTLVLITHNIRLLPPLCKKFAVLYEGRIVEYGDVPPSSRDFDDHLHHPYTIDLFNAIPNLDQRWNSDVRFLEHMEINIGCSFRKECRMYSEINNDKKKVCEETAPTPFGKYQVACHWISVNDSLNPALEYPNIN